MSADSLAPRAAGLVRWARDSVRHALGAPRAIAPDAAWARTHAASFVTLRWATDGSLQGCIGSLEARQPVVDDVAHNAVSAALRDPRVPSLRALEQVDRLDVGVSILSPLEHFPVASEAHAADALRPGRDGVVLTWRGRRATLLPSVWDRLGDGATFLRALKHKAGMPADAWAGVDLWRYTVDEHVDPAPHATRRVS